MRILIVSQYFWPENFRINELAASLVERGHEITVLTGIPNYPEGRFFPGYGVWKKRSETYRGCRVVRVPLIPRGKNSAFHLAMNGLSFALSATLFSRRAGKGPFDVIFVWESSPVTVAIPAIAIGRMRKIPLVFWILDLWPESLVAVNWSGPSLILGLIDRLVRFIYRRCDLILVASRGFIPSVLQRGGSPHKVQYFPNWAEDVYRPEPRLNGPALPWGLPEGFRVVFAGNIGAAQDPENILAAAEILKSYSNIHWVLVGDGRMRDWVREQIAVRGLSATVHLLPRHPPEDMPRLFAYADALLVTLRRDPTFAITVPGKIQSYLATGKPIVGALEGEARRILEESGAGIACQPQDATGLAEAVLAIFRAPESERAEMGLKGRRYCADNFARVALMDRLETMLLTAVASAKGTCAAQEAPEIGV